MDILLHSIQRTVQPLFISKSRNRILLIGTITTTMRIISQQMDSDSTLSRISTNFFIVIFTKFKISIMIGSPRIKIGAHDRCKDALPYHY